eukprot:8783776-Karenia_brevis.AAC.1
MEHRFKDFKSQGAGATPRCHCRTPSLATGSSQQPVGLPTAHTFTTTTKTVSPPRTPSPRAIRKAGKAKQARKIEELKAEI